MKNWKTFRFVRNRNEVIQRARSMGVIRSGDPLDHDNPRIKCTRCPRVTQADMYVKLDNEWVCDACWTRVRRNEKAS